MVQDCEGNILGFRTDPHVQIATIPDQIHWNVILKQHVRLLQAVMDTEFVCMDDNARPHRANILSECRQSRDITRMYCSAFSSDLDPV
ncbi:transposable element Tc3 transposase [Trichonephila clavipes]|nr:transposable element Tc3 transposase [Trichonephila clavipes]